jgi:hypothetical protein
MAAGTGRRKPLPAVMADRDLMAITLKGINNMGGSFVIVFDQQDLHRRHTKGWGTSFSGQDQRDASHGASVGPQLDFLYRSRAILHALQMVKPNARNSAMNAYLP